MKNNPSLLCVTSVLIAVFLSNCVTRDVNSDTKEFIVNYYQTLEKKEVYKASGIELVKTLNQRFDEEKTKSIMKAFKEIRNK